MNEIIDTNVMNKDICSNMVDDEKNEQDTSNNTITSNEGKINNWVLIKKMYILLNDECTKLNILDIFSCIIKSCYTFDFSNELYYLENKILCSNFFVRNSHISNIDIVYYSNYNKDITCSISLNFLNNEYDNNNNNNIKNELPKSNEMIQKEEILNNNHNTFKQKNRNDMTTPFSTCNDILKNLLFIDISFNNPIDCINNIFIKEKNNLYLYLEKKKSIYNLLKLICLTYEFHHNFYILINKTNEHLRKTHFLNIMDPSMLFDIQYENLFTINLICKDLYIYNNNNNNNNNNLCLCILLHPEYYSQIIIIPYLTCYNNKNVRNDVSFKKKNYFFKNFKYDDLLRNKQQNYNGSFLNIQRDHSKGVLERDGKITRDDLLSSFSVQTYTSLNNQNVFIDNMDEEDLFIYLFLNYCNLINFNITNNNVSQNYNDKISDLNKTKNKNEERSFWSSSLKKLLTKFDEEIFSTNDLRVFEEYEMFISNIKYILKMKNKIISSEVFFFSPYFLPTVLYNVFEFLRTLGVWLTLLGRLKNDYTDINLRNDRNICNVFQYITAKKNSKSWDNQPNPEVKNMNTDENNTTTTKKKKDDNDNQNDDIYIHLIWNIYNVRTLYTERLNNDRKINNAKRKYETFHTNMDDIFNDDNNCINIINVEDNKEENIKDLKYKKLKTNEGEKVDNEFIQVTDNNIIEINPKKKTSTHNEEQPNINTINENGNMYTYSLINSTLTLNNIHMKRWKYLINTYCFNNYIMFFQTTQNKYLLNRRLIKKAFFLRSLKFDDFNDIKSYYKKVKEINYCDNNHKNNKMDTAQQYIHYLKEDQKEKELINFDHIINYMSDNIWVSQIHYLTHGISLYFENVGEEVDEEDAWFYYNILKENCEINCSLNIIYKYIRIWLLRLKLQDVDVFFCILNEVINDKKKICEFSSLVFNSVLSYYEHLDFWLSKNTDVLCSPFIETQFTLREEKDVINDNINNVEKSDLFLKYKKNKNKEIKYNDKKFIEIIIPFIIKEKGEEKNLHMDNILKYNKNDIKIDYNDMNNSMDIIKNEDDKEYLSNYINNNIKNIKNIKNNNDVQNSNMNSNYKNIDINMLNALNCSVINYNNIKINYKIWRYMPCPFKIISYNKNKLDILKKNNDSIILSFQISSLPVKNLKDVYINNEPFIKFLVTNHIDLNVAHERVMNILQKYNLKPNYSLVATQTILHISTFELLLNANQKKE
ncbi:hypothetical protein PFFCH_01086 [Plasmodium falciparum FCH/4]|uniref:Uncharacterized protein n=1 Tax=Plasmodium falciparum FCH/4 TaxID=1036724 RepID=A0A024VT56_PLAFA|nr:hypothetical protein PFFCH_01086 [Plasmodium falciparum FCH/4]